MGTVRHWVTRFEPTAVIVAVIWAAAIVTSSDMIASSLKGVKVVISLTNETTIKEREVKQNLYRVREDGSVEKVK